MIDELLKARKISPEEYDLYMLYRVNELGRKVFDGMMLETFMDEPREKEFGGIGFAFYDGRRSVWRDVQRALLNVDISLKESVNNE